MIYFIRELKSHGFRYYNYVFNLNLIKIILKILKNKLILLFNFFKIIIYLFKGEFFTLQLLHNSKNLDNEFVDCMSLDFHGRPTDLARNMEGKGRIQDGVASEVCF